jgi:hypothetical protein
MLGRFFFSRNDGQWFYLIIKFGVRMSRRHSTPLEVKCSTWCHGTTSLAEPSTLLARGVAHVKLTAYETESRRGRGGPAAPAVDRARARVQSVGCRAALMLSCCATVRLSG